LENRGQENKENLCNERNEQIKSDYKEKCAFSDERKEFIKLNQASFYSEYELRISR